MMRLFAFVALALLCPLPARAWDAGGHMLVAQIAQARLTPKARASVDALMASLVNPARPAQKYDFVTAAAWMDDIRDAEDLPGAEWTRALSPQHYVNPLPTGALPPPPHAVQAIEDASRLLQDTNASPEQRALALGILLHVVGDIHQPLHATGRLRGGNDYPIFGVLGLFKGMTRDFKSVPYRGTGGYYQRLHALWDSAYRYDVVGQDARRRIAALYDAGDSLVPDRARIQRTAALLMANFPPGSEQGISDPAAWTRESKAIADEWAFDTPYAKQPSLDYVHRAHDTAARRIVLAGVRLGDLLNSILT